jgi:hypothetical protein
LDILLKEAPEFLDLALPAPGSFASVNAIPILEPYFEVQGNRPTWEIRERLLLLTTNGLVLERTSHLLLLFFTPIWIRLAVAHTARSLRNSHVISDRTIALHAAHACSLKAILGYGTSAISSIAAQLTYFWKITPKAYDS